MKLMQEVCIFGLLSMVFCNGSSGRKSSGNQQAFIKSTNPSTFSNFENECCENFLYNIIVTELSDRVVFTTGKSAANVEFEVLSDSNIRIQKIKPLEKFSGKTYSSHGIFGIFKMPTGYHIGLIMNSTHCDCCIPNLRRVTDIKLVRVPNSIPIAEDSQHVGAKVLAIEQAEAEHLLYSTFRRHSFYFCNGQYDITRSFQSNYRVRLCPILLTYNNL